VGAGAPGADFQRIETSGFLLKLGDGQAVGVTTAHSLFQEDPHRRLTRVALGINAQPHWLADADTYWGAPGVPFAGDNLTVDYVLLKLAPVDLPLALTPDVRGAPQPGERVTLFSGLGDGVGGRDRGRALSFRCSRRPSLSIWMLPTGTRPG
jgi:hypothetical protein